MKENQIESCQKCLLLKTYEWHKKRSTRCFIQKKAWDGVLKIDACAAAKHKTIFHGLMIFYGDFFHFCLIKKSEFLKVSLYLFLDQLKHLIPGIANILGIKMCFLFSRIFRIILRACIFVGQRFFFSHDNFHEHFMNGFCQFESKIKYFLF